MGPDADSGADGQEGHDEVDAFDDVVGSAITKAVRRAIDGVGRSPLAALDAPVPTPVAPAEPVPEPAPAVDTAPPPMPLSAIDDPYEMLGVSRRAPWPEITAAYKRRARAWHPDGAGEDERERREQLIRDLNGAYAELRVRRGK